MRKFPQTRTLPRNSTGGANIIASKARLSPRSNSNSSYPILAPRETKPLPTVNKNQPENTYASPKYTLFHVLNSQKVQDMPSKNQTSRQDNSGESDRISNENFRDLLTKTKVSDLILREKANEARYSHKKGASNPKRLSHEPRSTPLLHDKLGTNLQGAKNGLRKTEESPDISIRYSYLDVDDPNGEGRIKSTLGSNNRSKMFPLEDYADGKLSSIEPGLSCQSLQTKQQNTISNLQLSFSPIFHDQDGSLFYTNRENTNQHKCTTSPDYDQDQDQERQNSFDKEPDSTAVKEDDKLDQSKGSSSSEEYMKQIPKDLYEVSTFCPDGNEIGNGQVSPRASTKSYGQLSQQSEALMSENEDSVPEKISYEKRQEELNDYIDRINGFLAKVQFSKDRLSAQQNHMETGISNVKGEIHSFVAMVIDVVKRQADDVVAKLDEEFSQDLNTLKGGIIALDECQGKLLKVKSNIGDNFKELLQSHINNDQCIIKDQYMEHINTTEDILGKVQSIFEEPLSIVPSESIHTFKKDLKTKVDAILLSNILGEDINELKCSVSRIVEDFEDIMKAEKNEKVIPLINLVKEQKRHDVTPTLNSEEANTPSTEAHMSKKSDYTGPAQDMRVYTLPPEILQADSYELRPTIFPESLRAHKMKWSSNKPFNTEASMKDQVNQELTGNPFRTSNRVLTLKNDNRSLKDNIMERVNNTFDKKIQKSKSKDEFRDSRADHVDENKNCMNYIDTKPKQECLKYSVHRLALPSPSTKKYRVNNLLF